MREHPSKMAGKRALGKTDSHKVFGHPPGRRKTSCRAGLYARVSTHDHTLAQTEIERGILKSEGGYIGWEPACGSWQSPHAKM